MAWWNDFTSSISGLGAFGKTITGGSAYLSPEEQKKEKALADSVKANLASVDEQLNANPVTRAAKAGTKQVADFLLQGAVKLNNNVISPYITRPAATLGLLTDLQSPLYKKGQYEAGFQFSDITAAYERSKKVSTFQALTKSDLTPISGLSALVLPAGGIDMNQVDLWNDENIKKNFVDNAVGRWFTGIGDFVIGNKVFGAAGKVAGTATKMVAKPLGLYTKGKTVEQLATDMETGINWAKSNGTIGSETVSGSHVIALAQSKDWGTIEDIVTKYSTNEKLIPLIHEASDPMAVRDILLADKGNIDALARLAQTESHKLFDMADVKGQLQSKFIQTGKPYLPEGAAVPRLQKAFDDAIAADPQFSKLKDAFFNEDYSLTPGGKAYMPIEPKYGASALIKGQEKIRGIKTAIRGREYDAATRLVEGIIGETAGGLVMKGVRLAGRGTESLPTGFVSFSGLRPLQARVELNGFLNDMKLFRNGAEKIEVSPGVYEKVSSIRQRMENRYMQTLGQDSVSQVNALKEIDSEVGRLLAYKNGIYDQNQIEQYVSNFQRNVTTGLQSVQNNGFGITHDGNAMLVHPQTVRQLAESYRFTPWNDIEREIAARLEPNLTKRGATLTTRAGHEVFIELNRLWTFDVLARPSYAFKQSLFEPIISSGLSQGITFVKNDIFRVRGAFALRNMKNFTLNKLSTMITNKAELKAVTRLVEDKARAHQIAVAIKETAQSSVEELLTTASPATKAQHLPTAVKELKAASKILDDIELELRDAIVPYGGKEAIPSISTLERRVAYLEANPSIAKKSAEIAEAKAAVANYRNTISKLATNKKVIIEADDAVEAAYKKIDNAISELSDAQRKQADVFGKNAEFKKRYYAEEIQYRTLENGEVVSINSFIQDPAAGGYNAFTAAIREETKNGRTSQINYLGELSTGQTVSLIKRKQPMSRISVNDPLYFEELAYQANRFHRGDPLMDLIFAEKSTKEIQQWASTGPGKSYLSQFVDIKDADAVANHLADKTALMQRMYPSMEARAAILNREVTSQELQKFLAPYANELYDITPSNHNYAASTFGMGGTSKAVAGINNFMAKQFNRLASVENPIRGAMFDKMAIDNVARRAEYLMAQGVEMTPARYNALRQAAGREALQEMEKTLYTINNPNRFINSLRMITAFPAANVNAFMRYGRLAAKNPVRATGFAYNYGRTFETFGVDENGNPTKDINKITHLIVPGTKDLGLGPRGEGVKLSAQSLGFMLNRGGPSFITSLSMGTVMQQYPKTEKQIEEFLTIGGTNYYKVFYPYGAPTSVKDSFVPPYGKAAWNWLNGPEGNADYLSSWKSIYNYHAMLVEMGVEKDMPSDEQIRSEVKGLFGAKFVSTFASVFAGVPYKVDNNPMSMVSNLYYKIQERNKAAGMSSQDARDAAGEELLTMMGPGFMLDRVSYTGSSKNLNIPATYEAYSRVFEKNNDLVGRLVNIEPGNIGLVGLLTADLDYDPAAQSNNILKLLSNKGTVLPGTSKNINELKMTPQEIETERIKQRTWNEYISIKTALESKITDGQTLRGHPELKAVLDNYASGTLKKQSQAWYDEFQMAASGDKSYKYARALTEITNDKNFMKDNNSQFWKDAKAFVDARVMFAGIYNVLPDYDPRKAKLSDAYNMWVSANASQWDSNLKNILTRYFDNDTLKVVN